MHAFRCPTGDWRAFEFATLHNRELCISSEAGPWSLYAQRILPW